jgi:ABC-type multidrug transport system permease subunit
MKNFQLIFFKFNKILNLFFLFLREILAYEVLFIVYMFFALIALFIFLTLFVLCQPMCCGLCRGFWLLEKSCMIHLIIYLHIFHDA